MGSTSEQLNIIRCCCTLYKSQILRCLHVVQIAFRKMQRCWATISSKCRGKAHDVTYFYAYAWGQWLQPHDLINSFHTKHLQLRQDQKIRLDQNILQSHHEINQPSSKLLDHACLRSLDNSWLHSVCNPSWGVGLMGGLWEPLWKPPCIHACINNKPSIVILIYGGLFFLAGCLMRSYLWCLMWSSHECWQCHHEASWGHSWGSMA